MKDRCTGHCCEKFSLDLSPEELAAGYQRWLGRQTEPLTMNQNEPTRLYQDIHLIAPMVTYLGHLDKHPPRVNPTDAELLGQPPERLHYYRCKHLDPKTRDCTIYEIRPAMCRTYPDAGACDYAACTWKSRKAKKETEAETLRRRNKLVSKKDKPK